MAVMFQIVGVTGLLATMLVLLRLERRSCWRVRPQRRLRGEFVQPTSISRARPERRKINRVQVTTHRR
jgi:hypothetical protein